MMSLRRLHSLADSYGADLHRWPAAERNAAQALLSVSAEARAVLADVAALDAALAAHRQAEPAPMDAAFARLRAGVEARLDRAAQPALQPARRDWFRWFGIAAGGGAVAAGLVIGLWGQPASATSGDVLALLQPEPIHAAD